MNITINPEVKLSKTDNLFVLLTEDSQSPLNLPDDLTERVRHAIDVSKFSGRDEETICNLGEAPRKITLVGLGKSEKLTHRSLRAALAKVATIAKSNRDANIAVAFPYKLDGLDDEETMRQVADLTAHADYRYSDYMTMERETTDFQVEATILAPISVNKKTAKRLTEEARKMAEAVRLVRDLGNGPGNLITPTELGNRAQAMAKEYGLKCQIFDKKQIEKMKMGGLLSVNQGSDEEPRFIVLEHQPKKAKKTIVFVGKGITFDSGGISIKPSNAMEEMKFDMCGAAAVVGIMQAVAALDIPHHVVGLIPSTENLPSGSAYKPGDIITTMSGKTVEIVNTDAEGRMILCDAIHYSQRFEPDHLIDLATLTGACVIALGNEVSALFSNDDELASKLASAGEHVGERLWRMPEWDEYRELIASEWADVKNSGGRAAGSITAALFLKEFVECDSWAHIDIAGTAWTENKNARDRKGATGVGVRAALALLQSID
ncbi:MAG: leucyl aminopeptidase [Thermoanaerobaculia bacterium]|nr:leucyl aminopeptidase [Thermoanaerobaculia bacterium]